MTGGWGCGNDVPHQKVSKVVRASNQRNILLSPDVAKSIRERVESGQYASEGDVIRQGLRALSEREEAMESWLKQKVVPSVINSRESNSRKRSVAQVRASLKAARTINKKKP